MAFHSPLQPRPGAPSRHAEPVFSRTHATTSGSRFPSNVIVISASFKNTAAACAERGSKLSSSEFMRHGELSSCLREYRQPHRLQFPRRQRIADNGKILPNPCGSRFSAANCGVRTPRKIWGLHSAVTVMSAANAHAGHGPQATVRRRSTSFSCSSEITRSAPARSPTSCGIATRRGGLSFSATQN
jgi:hypothetical protein